MANFFAPRTKRHAISRLFLVFHSIILSRTRLVAFSGSLWSCARLFHVFACVQRVHTRTSRVPMRMDAIEFEIRNLFSISPLMYFPASDCVHVCVCVGSLEHTRYFVAVLCPTVRHAPTECPWQRPLSRGISLSSRLFSMPLSCRLQKPLCSLYSALRHSLFSPFI